MVDCERYVSGWMKRYPREWGLVLCRKDMTQEESLKEFYGEEKVEEVGAADLAYCWWIWVLKWAFGVPDSVLERVDIRAHIDPKLTCGEQLDIFERLNPELKRYIEKHFEKVYEKLEKKALSPEEIEQLRFPTPEEAAKFCEEHPDICEAYPIIAEYLAEGQLSAERAKELIKAHPEVVEEIDNLTLEEAWEKYMGEKIREIREAWEKAQKLPPEQRRDVTLDLWFQLDEIERKLKERLKKEQEMERKKEETAIPAGEPVLPDAPPEVKELPGYLRSYLLLTKLNCVSWTEMMIEGRKYYVAEVIDEATEETVRIIVPWLYGPDTEIVTIQNKDGQPVQVCTYKKEVKMKYLAPASIRKVEQLHKDIHKEVEEKVPVPVPVQAEAYVNWSDVEFNLSLMKRTLENLKRAAENRSAIAVKILVEELKKKAEKVLEELKMAPVVSKIATDIKVARVLTEGEYEDIWFRFCSKLAEYGIKCDPYRDLFERYVQWDMLPAEAENAALSLAHDIIEEELAKRKEESLKEPKPRRVPRVGVPVKITWKHVNWAISAMAFDLAQAQEHARKRNATGVFQNVQSIVRSCETILSFFKT